MKRISHQMIEKFKLCLSNEEKSKATQEKYIRDVTAFEKWNAGKAVDKKRVLEYKEHLIHCYAPASVNSMLSSLNSFFLHNEWFDCRVKQLKIQKKIFVSENKVLTKMEYEKLLNAALTQKNRRLCLLMQTICSTGIRVSELQYITVDAVSSGQAVIHCKGKMRVVMLASKLCKALKAYLREEKIKSGSVFVSRHGNPLNRSNIWNDMKKLCEAAGVDKNKVFPHNLRHLFARTCYSMEKDIVRLADILGHSNINTTRIYTMETGEIHRKLLQKLDLLRC